MSGGIYTTKKRSDNIVGLGDVSTDNLQDNDVLLYNATTGQWENGIVGGGDAIELVETNNLVSKLGIAGSQLNSGAIENIFLGLNAAKILTIGDKNVCIGSNTGTQLTSGSNNVFVGEFCGGSENPGINYSVAIGWSCCAGGNGGGGDKSVSIGYRAGAINPGIGSVNIGNEAARGSVSYTDSQYSINIGHVAGRTNPKEHCINMGSGAGYNGTSIQAINIGREAGNSAAGAGSSSINLGAYSNQINGTKHNQAIVINATGANVPSVANDTFVVKPVRGVAHGLGVGVMKYDPATGEITYSTT